MPFPSLVAAHHIKVFLNGVVYGYTVGVPNFTIETEYREAREIDSNIPRELIPGQYRVSGTLQVLRGRDTGGLEGSGLVASGTKMLLQKHLDIALVDRLTDQTIFHATRCQITRQTWSINIKQLVVGTFSFIGTSFDNESKS